MTLIPSRVSGHPVNSALSLFEQLLESAPASFDQQQPDLLSRARAITPMLRERLQNRAIAAVSDSVLSNFHSWLQQATNELQAAINQQNPAVLANGGFLGGLDAISQNIGQLPFVQSSEALAVQLDEAQRRVSSIQQIQHDMEASWRAVRDQQTQLLKQASDEVASELEMLQGQREAAAKLLAALGGEATSKGYRETAAAEKQSADIWRKLTIGLGAVTAIAALLLFTVYHEPGWESALRRSGVVLPFLILAVYAGRQAAEHRHQERQARRLQLAFGSVDAYLADLGGKERAELKNQLSFRLFADPDSSQQPVLPTGYPSSSEIVTLLVEALRRDGAGGATR